MERCFSNIEKSLINVDRYKIYPYNWDLKFKPLLRVLCNGNRLIISSKTFNECLKSVNKYNRSYIEESVIDISYETGMLDDRINGLSYTIEMTTITVTEELFAMLSIQSLVEEEF